MNIIYEFIDTKNNFIFYLGKSENENKSKTRRIKQHLKVANEFLSIVNSDPELLQIFNYYDNYDRFKSYINQSRCIFKKDNYLLLDTFLQRTALRLSECEYYIAKNINNISYRIAIETNEDIRELEKCLIDLIGYSTNYNKLCNRTKGKIELFYDYDIEDQEEYIIDMYKEIKKYL